jgi:regulator of protease activity HflC (stomatin/prohibitin superfamily)
MFIVVPAGQVGVPVVMGEVKNKILHEGFHFVNPLASIQYLSARTHTYTMSAISDEGQRTGDDSIDAISKNGMLMHMDVSVPHRLIPETAPWVYKNLGPNYDADIIRPAIATAVREATAHFTEEEAYATKREELASKMRDRLEAQIANILKSYQTAPQSIIVFPEVQLRKVSQPQQVQDAINEKIATEHKIVQAQNEAKRKEVEAGGIKKFQDIVSQGITPDLLKWKGIEATEELAKSPNSKIILVPAGKDLPVILGGDSVK